MGIPENATFVNEYTLGGPGESIILQEWSDAVPLHHSKYSLATSTSPNLLNYNEWWFHPPLPPHPHQTTFILWFYAVRSIHTTTHPWSPPLLFYWANGSIFSSYNTLYYFVINLLYLGFSMMHVRVRLNFLFLFLDARRYLAFTLNNCYISHEDILAGGANLTDSISNRFYDFVEGIENPNVFVVPPSCPKSPYHQRQPFTTWP